MTGIQWTDETLNPFRARYTDIDVKEEPIYAGWHCERVSPGCENCYAETFNFQRLGTGLQYTRPNRDRVEHFLDERMLAKPLHWRKPRRVFISSMTDIFGEWVPDEWLDRLFAVMALTPQHTYQLLSKRPERMREYLANPAERCDRWIDAAQTMDLRWDIDPSELPLPNVWLGVSVEDQRRADERIPVLLETPAAVRFLSVEPLLGPVDLRAPMEEWICEDNVWRRSLWGCLACGGTGYFEPRNATFCVKCRGRRTGISWVIVGGESGTGARPMDIAWARSLRDQCRAASVPFFMKQFGARPLFDREELPDNAREYEPYGEPGHYFSDRRFEVKLRDRHGGDMAEWPEDLRIREFPLRRGYELGAVGGAA